MHETHRDGLRLLHAGSGSTTVLLLHGLGATADVWRDLGDLLADDGVRVIAPDLPGHGGSAPLRRYGFGTMAAALSPIIDPSDEVTVVGHSLGGVVGLTLATGWFGVPIGRVVALGVKVRWSADDLAKARVLAGRDAPAYGDRAAAMERHRTVSGLMGVVDADDDRLAAGVRQEPDGRWRPALDQAAFAVGAPDVAGLLEVTTAVVLLARGENDPLVSDEDLATLVDEPVTLAGLGHNAHVEDPGAVARLLAS